MVPTTLHFACGPALRDYKTKSVTFQVAPLPSVVGVVEADAPAPVVTAGSCHVYFVSAETSVRDLSLSAKRICQAITSNTTNVRAATITPGIVNANLWASSLPEPDLVLRFGSYCTFGALFPWHVATTELLHFRSLRYLHYGDLMERLALFATKKQRFGA
eukprot:TRINITY_DN9907_c1_g1_i2.p1 TRINITY_DN9907_c1_g1~~TRINITY_DN9907_c1_g1_i2.p1  ORF type:complete len:160 (-),score=15.66 TRINITY_DN9907_c1_g1_i2:91-570(-)